VGVTLDISRINFPDVFFTQHEQAMEKAFAFMDQLEAGDKVNPNEKDDAGEQGRMVGHYWLRNPDIAPNDTIRKQIAMAIAETKDFAKQIHQADAVAFIPPQIEGQDNQPRFTDVLIIGIGGSALGPQLVASALANTNGPDKMAIHFIDNTDPDGVAITLENIGTKLASTLVIVISKSGGTPETRNGMIETKAVFKATKLDFAKQAVAITGQGSALDELASQEQWLGSFPMWDWVGGRTSITSAVGLLPMALQGLDIDAFLDGAAAMDNITRKAPTAKNPAALLALMWHHETQGRGEKDMVVIPYKDRLVLMSKYLQQLVMESIGKEMNYDGTQQVNQGIAVYGNKGSTDQHAYVQQLRDGVHNFFANFIIVLRDQVIMEDEDAPKTRQLEVEPNITSGDYLNGFWQGTRQALTENGRGSITLTLDALTPRSLGALIALYERAVGFYATLVDINAYNQPGVEAGKKAAQEVLDLQLKVIEAVKKDSSLTDAASVADAIDQHKNIESINLILQHLRANDRLG
jgi:glucose-6-phosphate isomerase